MVVQMVFPPELLSWATGFVRDELARMPESVCRGVEVGSVEPDVGARDFPAKMIVIGDNGSTDGDLVVSDASLRVVTICESKRDVLELSRIVHAVMRSCARPVAGNPVAFVSGARGPMFAGEEQPRFRRMSTFDLVLVGDVVER